MDKRALQLYAVWAKNNLESQIEVSLKTLGINSEHDIKEARKVGDYTIIDGDSNSYPGDLKDKRDSIVKLVKTDGYKQVIEEFAYTWFNRIVALRFMEVHDFLPHGFRVLSSRDGGVEPEIMKHLDLVKDELKLDLSVVQPLYAQGKLDEAYSYVLFRQCYALSGILPMLFDRDQDYLELLLPKALLKGETFITKLMEIGEDDFLNDVEVIGWLYQFYVADDRQTFRDAKVVTKDLIPTLTQVFTPDWIVRYMAENSVGRIWLESYPNSSLKSEMKYYVDDAKQEADVQSKLDSIKYKNINPEEIKIIEPCCGSGHILVYVFDLLYKMYEERGYQTRDIPSLILKNNLVGLEIDKRAAQLASFSLVMKARALNSRFFSNNYYVKPLVYEIWDSRDLISNNYEESLNELKFLTANEIKEIKWLVEKFRYAKIIGSLLKFEKKNYDLIESIIEKIKNNAVITIFNSNFLGDGIRCLYHLLAQAKVMSAKYDVMITNPPYLGISKIESAGKQYLSAEYPGSKSDMFAMFMEAPYVKKNGFIAMVNPDSWMFLSSYDELRNKIVNTQAIINMIHLGMGDFDATVHTTSFVIRNVQIDINGTFFRLNNELDKEKALVEKLVNPYIKPISTFKLIPADILGYWLTPQFIRIFKEGVSLNSIAEPRQGLATADNNRFLRLWHEVNIHKVIFNAKEPKDVYQNNYKWVPYNKGGALRKWYGDNDFLINWENNGKELKEFKGSVIRNPLCYFKPSVTWSKIGTKKTSFRYKPNGFIFDVAGTSVFADEHTEKYLIALLNSVVIERVLEFMSPSLNFEVGHIAKQPVIIDKQEFVENISNENIAICKEEWDDFEDSWDFKKHPLINPGLLEDSYNEWARRSKERFNTLKSNEELLNKTFIEIYKLEEEIKPEINDEDIYLRLADKEREIKSLISYLIGVEMGRYSLDVDGLAYAGGEWNPMNYVTYQPDDDGIIPIYTQLGMADGLTARIIKLIKYIYGEDTYRENIEFIAEALGKNQNESAEETLNRYLNYGFYADHLKTYQKRPIYWMFSSGKNDAFKCLVYLHRYNEDTLAKINSKYFLNESARLNVEVNETRTLLEAADGREKLRLDKQMKLLNARQKEMIEYGQVLDHMANQYINLDLDDGVKVNYAKFQGIEIVNDSGAKVKKDLLVPIK
jgi:hypothetical protein